MRPFGVALLATVIAVACFGQGSMYGSHASGARMGLPGTPGPLPSLPTVITPLNPTGARFVNRGGGGAPLGRGGYHEYRHSGQGAVLIPYPVFSYYDPSLLYGGQQEAPAQDPAQAQGPAAPTVIINQNFIADHATPLMRTYGDDGSGPVGMQSYQAPGPPAVEVQSSGRNDEQPTMYLIAFRDHTIVPALAYWTEGNTLKYVNVDHTLNQATLDLIDRDLSQTLNQQRNVEFKLPAH